MSHTGDIKAPAEPVINGEKTAADCASDSPGEGEVEDTYISPETTRS